MKYDDAVYGVCEIGEGVLLDLMSCGAMQRLKGVIQQGITGLIGVTTASSRFDHSVGAMLLVRLLGGSLEEQIAALLHDVSHTAFSHVIDFVVDDSVGQSYHDRMKEGYLVGTDVPGVLAGHGYDWRMFLREEDFAVLEQPAPRLCGDRVDYFLRDCLKMGMVTPAGVGWVLSHLIVHEGRIMMDDVAAARWLGYSFLRCDETSWANFREVGLYELAGQAIRYGIEVGAISEADFWGVDEVVWAKLLAFEDGVLRDKLALVSRGTRFVWDAENPTFWTSTKLRSVDPDVLVSGRVRRLSELDLVFAEKRAAHHAKKGLWPMRVVRSA